MPQAEIAAPNNLHNLLVPAPFILFHPSMKQSTTRSPKPARIAKSIKKGALPIELKDGQLWKMEGRQMEIMRVGKHLADYRLHGNQSRVSTSSGTIREIQSYLKDRDARQVKNNGLAKDFKFVRQKIRFGKPAPLSPPATPSQSPGRKPAPQTRQTTGAW